MSLLPPPYRKTREGCTGANVGRPHATAPRHKKAHLRPLVVKPNHAFLSPLDQSDKQVLDLGSATYELTVPQHFVDFYVTARTFEGKY